MIITLLLDVLLLDVLLRAAPLSQGPAGPMPIASPLPIERPQDRRFHGTITLQVDATDTAHKVFSVRERIPVQSPGPMTLLYPRWETASHSATEAVANLAGLIIHTDGTRIEWQRDGVDPHAFHVDVPAGVLALDIDFQYLSPVSSRAGALAMTSDIVNVQWQNLVLYPAGWFARNLAVEPTLVLPKGLTAFSSLDVAHAGNDATTFAPVSLEMLIDAPVYAGRFTQTLDLARKGAHAVHLAMLADAPEHLRIPAEESARLRALVVQAERLFRSTHYDRYEMIVTLSDKLPSGGGIEHLESGENNLPTDYFTDLAHQLSNRDLIAHELVHSWNGRFRQPADLWTPDFNTPAITSLLWVYEGQTEFWGRILAARARLRTTQETLDALALDAATTAARVGRSWKSLQDSTSDSTFVIGHSVPWRDWQRREDYYPEGVMLWLDVDAILRERSHGKRSLDDFARAFFGIHDGSRVTVTYTFDDVCSALNAIVPYDWRVYFRHRLDTHDDDGLLDGLRRNGYRLAFKETPTESFRQAQGQGIADLTYSIGVVVGEGGLVRTVAWQGPAFRAGLAPGAKLVSINGHPYDHAALEAAVKTSSASPLDLKVEQDGRLSSVRIDYRGTLRYPVLERVPGTPDALVKVLAPLAR